MTARKDRVHAAALALYGHHEEDGFKFAEYAHDAVLFVDEVDAALARMIVPGLAVPRQAAAEMVPKELVEAAFEAGKRDGLRLAAGVCHANIELAAKEGDVGFGNGCAVCLDEIERLAKPPCVSPNGRTDGHGSYVAADGNGGLVCAFCKGAVE